MATEHREDETLEEYRARLKRENRERYPRLAKFQLQRPWDEKDDLWFEFVTGETLAPDERATRNADL